MFRRNSPALLIEYQAVELQFVKMKMLWNHYKREVKAIHKRELRKFQINAGSGSTRVKSGTKDSHFDGIEPATHDGARRRRLSSLRCLLYLLQLRLEMILRLPVCVQQHRFGESHKCFRLPPQIVIVLCFLGLGIQIGSHGKELIIWEVPSPK